MSLWNLIIQTDIISKFVMILLLILSFITWACAVYKLSILKLKIKQLKSAQPLLFHVSTIEDLVGRASTLQQTFAGELLAHYLTELKKICKYSQVNNTHIDKAKPISQFDYDRLYKNIEQTAINALDTEENAVPMFSTIAQIAPLLGLFGTVWGLIHSFMSIAQLQQVDIATIAPGISEALLTTLAGLIVAVPALVLFNVILSRVRLFEQQVVTLTQTFLDQIKAILVIQIPISHTGNTQVADTGSFEQEETPVETFSEPLNTGLSSATKQHTSTHSSDHKELS